MIPTRTIRMLYLAFETAGKEDSVDGFGYLTPHFKITSGGWHEKSGEPNASYLDVKWALEQMGAWAIARRSGLPMRQVPRPAQKGGYREADRDTD